MTHVGIRDASGRFAETFEVFARLPGPGSLTLITVRHSITVAEVKALIELACGIPTDLQVLSYRHRTVLLDSDSLGALCVLPGSRLLVNIKYGFGELVDAALRGDLRELLRNVSTTMDREGMQKRRFVAMFIAAQKGYHYMVDRMLRDGAHPDTRTPSGRTALHVASAVGNGACISSLLQHGASLDSRDGSGHTPADTAASCGQQTVQRRLLIYTQILANRVTGDERPCCLSMASQFPKSRLGSSVTPTISLKDLAISPGPELMITAWSGREHHHHYFEGRGHARPRSSKASSALSWSSLTDESVRNEQHRFTSETEKPTHTSSNDHKQLAQSAPLRILPPSAVPCRTRSAKSRIRFKSTHGTGSTGLTALPPSTQRYKTSNATIKSTHVTPKSNSEKQFVKADARRRTLGEIKGSPRNCNEEFNQHSHSIQEYSNSAVHDGERDDLDDGIVAEHDALCEANSLRLDYLNDKLRIMIGLPVEHHQRFESMGNNGDVVAMKQPCGSSRYRRSTPEENRRAYRDWLASKTQDARDKKLVERVDNMIGDAFCLMNETPKLIQDAAGEADKMAAGLTFQAWTEMKSSSHRREIRNTTGNNQKDDRTSRVKKEISVETWLGDKLEKQRQKRLSEKQKQSQANHAEADRESAANAAFQKWCAQKQLEELQMLQERANSGCTKRPKSGNTRRGPTPQQQHQTTSKRSRAQSAPARRMDPVGLLTCGKVQ